MVKVIWVEILHDEGTSQLDVETILDIMELELGDIEEIDAMIGVGRDKYSLYTSTEHMYKKLLEKAVISHRAYKITLKESKYATKRIKLYNIPYNTSMETVSLAMELYVNNPKLSWPQ